RARRGSARAEILTMRRAIAGLSPELACRALARGLAVGRVADQPCGQFAAALAERDAILLDQDNLASINRQDHRGPHIPGPPGVFPASTALRLDELARPFDLFGSFGIGGEGAFGHN